MGHGRAADGSGAAEEGRSARHAGLGSHLRRPCREQCHGWRLARPAALAILTGALAETIADGRAATGSAGVAAPAAAPVPAPTPPMPDPMSSATAPAGPDGDIIFYIAFAIGLFLLVSAGCNLLLAYGWAPSSPDSRLRRIMIVVGRLGSKVRTRVSSGSGGRSGSSAGGSASADGGRSAGGPSGGGPSGGGPSGGGTSGGGGASGGWSA